MIAGTEYRISSCYGFPPLTVSITTLSSGQENAVAGVNTLDTCARTRTEAVLVLLPKMHKQLSFPMKPCNGWKMKR